MKYNFVKSFAIAGALSVCMAGQSLAAGYSSDLYSASGLGNAYAGSVNGVHDASDIFHNPALSGSFEKGQFVVSASYIDLDINVQDATGSLSNNTAITGGDVADAGQDGLVPALYLVTPLSDRVAFGLSINTPFGLSTKYNEDWVGRYRAVESTIKTININPSLSYKVNDKLLIGAGIQAQYYEAILTNMAYTGGADGFAKVRANDWGHGYNLGLQYKPVEDLKLGIAYRSKIEHKLKGVVNATNTLLGSGTIASDMRASTVTPESVTFGVAYQLNPKVELAYDATWMRWSRVDRLVSDAHQRGDNNLDDTLVFNWRDSFIQSLGLNYKKSQDLILRFGLAYEKDAVADSNREPRVPTGNRIWTTFGFNYKLNDGFYLDGSYVRQFYKTQRFDLRDSSARVNSLDAKVDIDISVYSLAVRKEF